MKLEDDSQNLRVRLRVLHALVFALLAVLGARLYYLQVVRGEYYAERAESQRVRLLRIPAPRGAIFDRQGRLLVDSRSTYNVLLAREDARAKDYGELVRPVSEGLDVDAEILRERFEEMKGQAAFEEVTIKEGATPGDIAWVEAHAAEFPELFVREQPQRRYPEGGVLAHVLGYVGEIGPGQLKEPKFKDHAENPYHPGAVIGQEGVEAAYDRLLRGRDGYRKVEVDSHGRVQRELDVVPPQPGQDLVLTIDLDLQLTAEERLRNTPSKRGVIVALDPTSGEVLAMASAPTFDPNLFSQNATSRESRERVSALLRDPQTPLYNRAIRGRYPPGSTWKILMAMAGLEQGAVTVEESALACGGGIQVGSKFTRCMHSHGTPDLRAAIHHSCNGYFFRLGLRMGYDGLRRMVDEYELDRPTGVDLPHELASRAPSEERKARFNPSDPRWRDIDTVYASIGQVHDEMTPLAMLRAVSGVAVGGRLYVPHLLKEARPVGATPHFPARAAHAFDRAEPKVLNLRPDRHKLVLDGTWAVVNSPGGTGYGVRIEGFDMAGKTGTAQVVGLGKDTGANKDHAWFVSFAPAYRPEISVIALVENVGFGGTHAAPAARAVYDVYYRKTRKQEPPGAVAAVKR